MARFSFEDIANPSIPDGLYGDDADLLLSEEGSASQGRRWHRLCQDNALDETKIKHWVEGTSGGIPGCAPTPPPLVTL